MIEFIETTMITLGFFIMLLAIFMYYKLNASMQLVIDQIDKVTFFLFRTYIVLMIFFLGGYGFFDIVHILQVNYDFVLLISFIFFFGAIFVLIGMVVQIRLSDCIFKTNRQMIFTLISAIEARDSNLKGHSMHVMSIALLIYDCMDKSKTTLINRQKFEYACILHDIGKLGIPENVLNKPGALDDSEWNLMKLHPKIGSDILSNLKGLDDIRKWILYHHERVDGNGYNHLKENQIPLASKIISLADSYSAIIMKRSYKKEMPHEKAMEILKECVGTQFDPYVFSVFEEISKDHLEKLFRINFANSQ